MNSGGFQRIFSKESVNLRWISVDFGEFRWMSGGISPDPGTIRRIPADSGGSACTNAPHSGGFYRFRRISVNSSGFLRISPKAIRRISVNFGEFRSNSGELSVDPIEFHCTSVGIQPNLDRLLDSNGSRSAFGRGPAQVHMIA